MDVARPFSGSRRPRVAILGSRGYPSSYGGFETFVRHLAPYLNASGAEVSVYCRGPGIRTRVEWLDGVRCVWTAGLDWKATSTLSYGCTASANIIRSRPDVALVLNVANGFYLPALHRWGIPTAVNVDGVEWERGKWSAVGKRVFWWGAKLSARYGSAIVVDSKAIGHIWQSSFGVRTHYIPYGAPLIRDPRTDRMEALGLAPNTYVLAVARLVPENNIELLLRALELLGRSVVTVVVGSAPTPTPLEHELRRLSQSCEGFHWLGHVNDGELLNQLWSNCAVYFHGHSVGGTNPALLQALGCGSPTIAIDTPYNREVIDHPEHLCAPDPNVLAGRIAEVVADETLRERMSERGRAVIASRYQWSDVCESYKDLLFALANCPDI